LGSYSAGGWWCVVRLLVLLVLGQVIQAAAGVLGQVGVEGVVA
jgi:hypothetical protein